MKLQAYLVHALSPLHAGVGHAADVIDLPIARMKATGIPIVPGSSVKGVLREKRSEVLPKVLAGERRMHPAWQELLSTFGPETDEAALHGGAVVIGDARLLALPVRTFRGTFAWVTSPLLLQLANHDMGTTHPIPTFGAARGAKFWPAIPQVEPCCCVQNDRVYLQDIDLEATPDANVAVWANELAPAMLRGQPDIFTKRFVVVDDESMAFLWETGTQVDQRIRIDSGTGTVAKGALWLEESLPPETLMIGLALADKSRRNGKTMLPEKVLTVALPAEGEQILQLGGKATTGRGRCRVLRFGAEREV